MATAAVEQGTFSRAPILRPVFWQAFILAGADTGLRIDDLLRLQREQIGADGSFAIVPSKTGTEYRCRLRPATLAAIDATGPSTREFIFGDVLPRRCFVVQFGRLLEAAGINGCVPWRLTIAAPAVSGDRIGADGASAGGAA